MIATAMEIAKSMTIEAKLTTTVMTMKDMRITTKMH